MLHSVTLSLSLSLSLSRTMQRQSLGSPISKLHSHGVPKDDFTLTDKDSIDCAGDDISCRKPTKPPRRFSFSSSSATSSFPSNPEKLVHFIPFLTLLCFLLLYLVSHTPSQSELAHFHGLKRSTKHLDSNEISEVDAIGEAMRVDVLAVKSVRNLQEIAEQQHTTLKSRLHRKIIADF